MSKVIYDYIQLFRGRADVYGTWTGGAIHEPLTEEQFAKHLTSTNAANWIGVYPNLGTYGCSWGCIDIDGGDFPAKYKTQHPDREGEWLDARQHPRYDRKDPQFHDWSAMWDLATLLVRTLKFKDIEGHIERTRNGFHVWIFPAGPPCPTPWVRRTLIAACEVVGYHPKEVFPKQELLRAGQVGNYVRLPYYGALATDGYSPDRNFLQPGRGPEDTLHIEEFLRDVTLTPQYTLEACHHLWTPPQVEHNIDLDAGLEAAYLLPKLGGLAYTIWDKGPLDGNDRSSTLAHLAHLCKEDGLTSSEAFTIVKSADDRVGQKFTHRDDGPDRIRELIEKVYS